MPPDRADEQVAGIGIDLVDIPRFAASLARFGSRLRDRLFTAAEQSYCDSHSESKRAQHYAARFAAKEAWIKAVGIAFSWKEIEVVIRAGTGEPALALHGRTRETAGRAGICQALVTLTHAGELAIAHVLVTAQEKLKAR